MIVEFKSEGSAQDTNQIFALIELYKLLNQAMHESAMTQGAVGTDLAQGLNKIADLLEKINKNTGEMQSEIQAKQADIDSFKNWAMGLSIVATVVGIAGPAIGGAFVGMARAGVELISQVLTILAGIAAGSIQVVKGEADLDVAKNYGTLATLNSEVTELNGHQKMYENADKWVTGQMSETFTRLADVTRSTANAVREVSQGLKSASEDTLRGILKSK